METMKIMLPESMRSFVEKRVADGNFSSVREYIIDLIRTDRQLRHEQRIGELLLEGFSSGELIEVDETYWQAKELKLPDRVCETRDGVLMQRVFVLPAADCDLDEQARYYLEHSAPKAARRWYHQAAATFEFLAGQPEIGVHEPRQAFWGVRSWPVSGFDRHDVFYRVAEEGIAVVRVLHGARDLDPLLDDR